MKIGKVCIILSIILLIGIGVLLLYQFTEVFGEKLIPIKVEQISIDYVPGYSLSEAETLNQEKEVVKKITIKLPKKDLQSLKKEIHFLSKRSFDKKKFGNHQIDIHINQDVTIQVGDGYGYVLKNKKKTKVIIPKKTMQVINQVVQKDQKKRVHTLETKNVTFKLEGASVTVKNSDNLRYIQNSLSYYPITLETDYKSFDGGYLAEMLLDQNNKIYLYHSKIGYIINGDKQEYGIFQDDLYDLIKNIYDYSITS